MRVSNIDKCEFCGNGFKPYINPNGLQKKYCSAKCRQANNMLNSISKRKAKKDLTSKKII